MENKNIIIILVAVVIVLAAIAGAMFLYTGNAKEPTKVKITSDKKQYEGGKLKIQLTDLNKTALSKQKVKIIIKNKKGKVVVNETVKTNSKGKAKLDLDLKKGKYKVNVTYDGNENCTSCNTTQKLKIEKTTTKSVSKSSSSDLDEYDKYSQQYGTYIREYTDSDGVQHIDGANGMHESYDPRTGLLKGVDSNGNEYEGYMR